MYLCWVLYPTPPLNGRKNLRKKLKFKIHTHDILLAG